MNFDQYIKQMRYNDDPCIEITAPDGKVLFINSDYKSGKIKSFMSDYTEKVRAGKKIITITKGDTVVNCGGGVYVAVPHGQG